jgi:dihydrodipicolinate synthase/N-acetylneuraminate lyase
VGIKTAAGGDEWWKGMQTLVRRLSIFVPGHALASGWRSGATGSYSNVACLHPVFAKRWNQQIERDWQRAYELEGRIQLFLRDYIEPFRTRNGVPNQGLDKLLAAVGGWANVGLRLRWPYSWVSEEAVPPLQQAARQLIPEIFEV